MLHGWDLRSRGALLLKIAAALGILLFGVQSANANGGHGETGNFCAGVYGAGSCAASDLSLPSMAVVQTVEPCTFVGDTGTFVFDATFVAGSNTRYNASMYVALNGGNANTGSSCYHDFLDPVAAADNSNYNPLTGPYFNAGDGDTCGDVQPNSTIKYQTAPLTIACVDSNNDGVVDDISTCTGWQQNSTGTCNSAPGATIGSPAKCNCGNVPIPGVAIRKIVVDKVTVPAGDPQSFGFTLKNSGGTTLNSFSLTDTATPFNSGVLPAATGYSVAETVPSGWDQTATCTNGLTTFSPSSIDLTLNRQVDCTFTNTKRGSITIIKDAIPNDAQDFSFTGTGPSSYNFGGGFSLDDDADPTLPNQRTFSNLVPGSYTVTEGSVWYLYNLTCTTGGSGNITTRTASITLPAGGSVTCTFTNTNPDVVNLKLFNATRAKDSILLRWETASETDNLGFNLYRSTSANGARLKLNAQLIPALPGSQAGADYSFSDVRLETGYTYFYWLEDVDIHGVKTLNGPVLVKTVAGKK